MVVVMVMMMVVVAVSSSCPRLQRKRTCEAENDKEPKQIFLHADLDA